MIDREREIAELAESIADHRFAGRRVEPLQLIRQLGITYSANHYGDYFDGMLEHICGRWHIYCNLDRCGRDSWPRGRFTQAHELGHYYIDDHRLALASGEAPGHLSQCDYRSKNPAEIEADLFASNLLMARNRFLDAIRRRRPGFSTVLELAETFGSSVTSTALRYVQLAPNPVILIKWDDKAYNWKWIGRGFRAAGYRKTIETLTQIPPDSSTARAVAGEDPGDNRFFAAGTTANIWFPYRRSDPFGSAILIEEAFPLGRFGVLTLLYPESGAL